MLGNSWDFCPICLHPHQICLFWYLVLANHWMLLLLTPLVHFLKFSVMNMLITLVEMLLWCVFAFDLLYPNHEFDALIVSPPGILTPAKMLETQPNCSFLCLFLTAFDYKYSPDSNFIIISLFMWNIRFGRISGRRFLILNEMFCFLMSMCSKFCVCTSERARDEVPPSSKVTHI